MNRNHELERIRYKNGLSINTPSKLSKVDTKYEQDYHKPKFRKTRLKPTLRIPTIDNYNIIQYYKNNPDLKLSLNKTTIFNKSDIMNRHYNWESRNNECELKKNRMNNAIIMVNHL